MRAVQPVKRFVNAHAHACAGLLPRRDDGRGTRCAQEAPADALVTPVAALSTADAAGTLSGEATRAVLFVKAGELIRSRAPPRAALLRFFEGLLAAGVLPALPAADSDADVLAALADAACGGGGALQANGAGVTSLATALAAAGLTPPGLTAAERAALLAGAAPSTAVAALAAARARKLLPAADAVSALSCEVRASLCAWLPGVSGAYLLRAGVAIERRGLRARCRSGVPAQARPCGRCRALGPAGAWDFTRVSPGRALDTEPRRLCSMLRAARRRPPSLSTREKAATRPPQWQGSRSCTAVPVTRFRHVVCCTARRACGTCGSHT